MAEEATADWLHRSSITYLECAISLMLPHISKQAVLEIMRAETKDARKGGLRRGD